MHLSVLLPLLLVLPVSAVTAVPGCHSDRDKDHRPRQNCTAAGYGDVPAGFEPSTKVLLFTRNQFSGLPWSSFKVFTEIYEIDLSNNKISALTPSSAPVLPSLNVLRLGFNLLTSVPENCFSASLALTELYLHNNVIHSLSNNSFSGLNKLEILDLSDNHIQTLPELMMHPLPAIETLFLENNKIKVMPDDWFSRKEEVPYLYLSANPWACSCSLGYLRRYLEEYEINVYVRDGPIIRVDVESVMCGSPQSLKGQSVINLDESDLCSAQADSAPTSTYVPPTEPTTTTATTTTAAITTATSTAEEEYLTKVYYSVVTWYETFTRYAERSDNWELDFRGDGRVVKTPTSPSNGPPTTSFTTADPTTIITASTLLPTLPATAAIEIQKTTMATTEADKTTSTEAIFKVNTVSNVEHSEHSKVSTVEGRGVFCFWLFVSCVLLCVTSALCSLFTALRLYFWYRGVYRTLKRVRVGKEHVRMVAYYRNIENEGVTALYRSVLFISKEEENKEEGEQVEELVVNLEQKDKCEEVKKEEKAVFRKTLYRVISKEEELESWQEMMGECRAVGGETVEKQTGGVAKKRYSVILREMSEKDGGETEKCDWVVGGWEVETGEGSRSSWGEWLGQYLPSMPWGVTTPPKIEDELEK